MAKTVIQLDDRKLQEIIQATGQSVKRRVISDGVSYGIHQEFGTSRMAAQPFLIPAFKEATGDLGRALGQAIEIGKNLDDVIAKTALDIRQSAQERAPVDTGALKNSLHVETE